MIAPTGRPINGVNVSGNRTRATFRRDHVPSGERTLGHSSVVALDGRASAERYPDDVLN
jgi:hypothetical protein